MKTQVTKLAAILLAATSLSSFAESIAITNATLYTAGDKGIIENATLVMDNGKITAINPANMNADTVIDAQHKIVTPGLIGSMNTVGLVEVSAVSASRDAGDKKADITFTPSLAFNPKSSVIPYSRKGGVTSNLVVPSGGEGIFKGQTFLASLSGEFDSILKDNNAVYAEIGAKRKGSRAMSLQTLFNTFEDRLKAQQKAKKAKKKDKAKQPSRKQQILDAILAGDKALIVEANRATDLLQLIRFKKQFKVNLVIASAADAVVVKKQIATANIPVIINAMADLPGNFDSMHQSLNNAGLLAKAGVKVLISVSGDAHNLYQMRFDAGNAVANGMDKNEALKAVTANVADAFHLNRGKLEVGKVADVVLWSGDPFELSTHVEKMWIAGKEVSTESRHDKLRNRYTTISDMPKDYTK